MRKTIALIILMFLGLGSKDLMALPDPVFHVPDLVCQKTLVEGEILNIPDNPPTGVFVQHNSFEDNYFVPPNNFKFLASDGDIDTLTIYFYTDTDTTFKTVYIEVLAPSTLLLYDTICSSELPYDWDGHTFISGGIQQYRNLIPSANGCDSFNLYNLFVLPTTSFTDSMTVCSDELPIEWNGITVYEGGPTAATYTTTGANGCDSISTLYLKVNMVKYTEVEEFVCFNDLPFTWYGMTIEDGGLGVATHTLSTFSGCDSVLSLNLNIAFSTVAVFSDTICHGDLPYIWNGFPIFGDGVGVATYSTTSYYGCDSMVSLNLYVKPTVYTVFKDTICVDELPYTWNGNTFTSGGIGIDSFFTTSTLYNCDSVVTLNLYVGSYDTITVFDTVCESSLPLIWNGISVTGGGTAVASYLSSSSLNCDSLTILDLTVRPIIRDTINMTVCSGSLPIEWNEITILEPGIGVAEVVNFSVHGCDSFSVLNLTMDPSFEQYDTFNICTNDFPYTLTGGLDVYEPGTYSYLSLEGMCDSVFFITIQEKINLESEQNDSICSGDLPIVWNGIEVSEFGYHVAYVSNVGSNGCDSFHFLNLYPYDDIEPPLVLNSEEYMMVLDPIPGHEYQWQIYLSDTESWKNIEGANEVTYTATVSGKYRVGVLSENCPTIYSNEVDIEVFTNDIQEAEITGNLKVYPNPTQDVLYLEGMEDYLSWELCVYNDLGQLLYQNKHTQTALLTINTKAWAPGQYFIVMINRETMQIIKVPPVIKQ